MRENMRCFACGANTAWLLCWLDESISSLWIGDSQFRKSFPAVCLCTSAERWVAGAWLWNRWRLACVPRSCWWPAGARSEQDSPVALLLLSSEFPCWQHLASEEEEECDRQSAGGRSSGEQSDGWRDCIPFLLSPSGFRMDRSVGTAHPFVINEAVLLLLFLKAWKSWKAYNRWMTT